MAADPTKDECIDANEKAAALQRSGKLRMAKHQLAVCVAKSCPGPVRDDCSDRLAAVDKVMPTVIFAAVDPGGNDLSAVRVAMDGELLADRLAGTPLSVDPGEHVFRFESPGLVPVGKKVVIRETEKNRRVAVAFSTRSADADATRADGASESAPDSATTSEAQEPLHWPTYVAFGVGGLGLVTGVVFAVSATIQKDHITKNCNGSDQTTCDTKYPGQQSTLTEYNILCGVGFAIGALGAGIGTYFLLSAPAAKAQARSLWVAPRIGLAWAGFEGGFQ